MKQIYYTLRYLLHSRGNNGIKIVSLTLGLAMSLVLFTQVAFDLSYDKFYPDADRIYRIRRQLSMGNGGGQEKMEMNIPIINAPVPAAMMKEFPEIEIATVGSSWSYPGKYTVDESDRAFTAVTMVADSLFLDVFSFPLLQGNIEGFRDPSSIYISESTALRIFGTTDAVGQALSEGPRVYTVRGVFQDLPKNCHMSFDMLKSMVIYGTRPGWRNNDAYVGYVKFVPGANPADVEAKIPAMLEKYYDVKAEIKSGTYVRYYFEPVTGVHMSEPTVKKTVLILWLMGLAILLVAAMNYVLISISSLANRAKSIGVHKCNGASAENIFSLFIYETVALVLVSVVLAILLIFGFRGQIEELLHTSLSAIFTWNNLWVSGLVIVILVLIAGVIPGRIFSRIPVTQVFRSVGTNKRRWKQVLLFVQFAGVAFMMTLLLILVRQYAVMLNEDLGYQPDNLVYTQHLGETSPERMPVMKAEFSRFPQVEKASLATCLPHEGMSGNGVTDPETKQMLFSTRFMSADTDFLEVMGIKLLQGRNFTENTGVDDKMLVNKKFLELAGLQDDPVGKSLDIGGVRAEIIGVVEDFHIGTLYAEQMPIVIFSFDAARGDMAYGRGYLILKLVSPDRETVQKFDTQLKEFTQDADSYFRFITDAIELSYRDARLLRNSILVAAIVLFIISIIGIVGYVSDEIFRRTKEIAIRRINGATAASILGLISKDIIFITMPAIIIGMILSGISGQKWQEQFVVKAPLDAAIFIASAACVLGAIALCIFVCTWRTANNNPVKSLRSE